MGIKRLLGSTLAKETGISLFLKISQAFFSFMTTIYQVALTKWHLRSVERVGKVEGKRVREVDGD